jgi:hypothetical protein
MYRHASNPIMYVLNTELRVALQAVTALRDLVTLSHRVEDVLVSTLVDERFEETVLFEQGSRTVKFDQATSIKDHLRSDVISPHR